MAPTPSPPASSSPSPAPPAIPVPPKGYLKRLRELCTKHGILLIFDEVITGFGRTGEAFAAQSFGVVPDIMTMAKALTNGSIPLAAIAVREDIQQTILDAAPENTVEFFHGYTYGAHPVACAAGLATLKIYREEETFAACGHSPRTSWRRSARSRAWRMSWIRAAMGCSARSS